MDLEYKSLEFEIKSISDKGFFEGIAIPFNNVDLGNDRALKSIENRNIGKKDIPYLWQHNSTEPIGKIDLIRKNNGIGIEGKLFLDTNDKGIPLIPNAQKAYVLMKNGILKNSIGYNALDYEYVTEENKTVRNLIDIDIKEVSAVTFPMNPKADITGVKTITGSTTLNLSNKDREWDGPAAEKRVLDYFRDEDGNISNKARRAFFWVDMDNPNIRKSYKLGFADIIDGKLTAIPRGIIAVAGALQGARGGVDISKEDMSSIKNKIEIYYRKMDMTPPWKKEGKGGDNNLEFKQELNEIKSQINFMAKKLNINLEQKEEEKKFDEVKKYIENLNTDSEYFKQISTLMNSKSIKNNKTEKLDFDAQEELKKLYDNIKNNEEE